MTTTKNSFPLVEEIIDEYIKSGFNSIFLRPLSPYGFAIKTKSFDAYQIDEWLEFYKRGLSYIINLNKQGLLFIEEYTSLILTKMLTPFGTSYVDLQSPSGIGISAIVFNYDGEVYASDESRMLAEMGDKKFRIGNLESNTYEEIMLSDALIEPIESSIAESSPGCSDCGFLPYCGSDPVYHYATQGDVVGKKPLSSFCTKNMAIFRHLITIMEDDKETADILNSWVRH
jgi:radical SAM protein with 4Fe4S-binding SPASM domain